MVVRGDEAVCEIVPPQREFTVADLAVLLKTLPAPDDAYLTLVESLQSGVPTGG